MKRQTERKYSLSLVLGSIALTVWVLSCFWNLEWHPRNVLFWVGNGTVLVIWSEVETETPIETSRADCHDCTIREMLGIELPGIWGIGEDLGELRIPLWPWPLLALATSQTFRRRPFYRRWSRAFVQITHHRAFRIGRRIAGAVLMVIAFLSVSTFAGVALGAGASVQQGALDLEWNYKYPHPPATWLEWSGFDFEWQWPAFFDNQSDLISATIPAWLLLPVGLFLLAYRSKHKPAEPSCKKCGYILIGNRSGVCSECGTRIGAPQQESTMA